MKAEEALMREAIALTAYQQALERLLEAVQRQDGKGTRK